MVVIAYPHANYCALRAAAEGITYAAVIHRAVGEAARILDDLQGMRVIDCQTPVRMARVYLDGLHERCKRLLEVVGRTGAGARDIHAIITHTHPGFLDVLPHYRAEDYLGVRVLPPRK